MRQNDSWPTSRKVCNFGWTNSRNHISSHESDGIFWIRNLISIYCLVWKIFTCDTDRWTDNVDQCYSTRRIMTIIINGISHTTSTHQIRRWSCSIGQDWSSVHRWKGGVDAGDEWQRLYILTLTATPIDGQSSRDGVLTETMSMTCRALR